MTGAGRPVILLHGFRDSGRLWRNQVPVLADAGFQVIVPDLRGYGRSDKPGTARVDGPGHWMQLKAPDAINQLLLDFLCRTTAGERGSR